MKLIANQTVQHGPKPTDVAKPGEAFTLDDEAEAKRLVDSGVASLPGGGAAAAANPGEVLAAQEAVAAFVAGPAPDSLRGAVLGLNRLLHAGTMTPEQHAEALIDSVSQVLTKQAEALQIRLAEARVAQLEAKASARGRGGQSAGDPPPDDDANAVRGRGGAKGAADAGADTAKGAADAGADTAKGAADAGADTAGGGGA